MTLVELLDTNARVVEREAYDVTLEQAEKIVLNGMLRDENLRPTTMAVLPRLTVMLFTKPDESIYFRLCTIEIK